MMKVNLGLYVCVLCFTAFGTLSKVILPPAWDSSALYVFKSEDTPIGSLLTSMRVTSQNGCNVIITTYDTITNERVYMNYTSGTIAMANVYLKQQLDRDQGISQWELFFRAYDCKIGMDSKHWVIRGAEWDSCDFVVEIQFCTDKKSII